VDAEANKQLVKRLFEAWSAGDIRPLIDAMSEDFRWVFPGSWSWSGVWQPKTAVVDGLLRGQLATQFSERYESHPDFFLADEDRVVVQTRGHTTTVRGDVYNNTYCLIFRISGRAVTEIIEHCDTALVDRVLRPPPQDAEGWTRASR
jgi:uncharacterized protein